ncbi:MAG: hypothetical protein K2K57_14710 [Oscillospiraceae bacterium]|nr:hypothetical protein [Oscillospiraceae bacterium]
MKKDRKNAESLEGALPGDDGSSENIDADYDCDNSGAAENADTDEDEGRPPVDPKNKLYTVISLLIFAVGYFGYHYIADNFSLESAYFIEAPAGDEAAAFVREIGWEYLPEGSEFLYARLHKNFDDNALYCAFLLPEAIEDPSDFEEYIPFDWAGPVSDERFTIYPEDNMIPDYVYGDSYVYREDPKIRCLIYKENDRYTAVFRTTDYGGGVRDIMRRGKIAR